MLLLLSLLTCNTQPTPQQINMSAPVAITTTPSKKRHYRKKQSKPPKVSTLPSIDPFRDYLLARLETKLHEWCELRPLSEFADVPAESSERAQLENVFAGAPGFLARIDDICAVHPIDSALFTAVCEKLNDAKNIYRNFFFEGSGAPLPWKKVDEDTLLMYSEEHDSFICAPVMKICPDKLMAFQLTHAAKQKIVSRFIRDHLLEADQMVLAAKNAIQRDAQQEFNATVSAVAAVNTTTTTEINNSTIYSVIFFFSCQARKSTNLMRLEESVPRRITRWTVLSSPGLTNHPLPEKRHTPGRSKVPFERRTRKPLNSRKSFARG